MLTQVRSTLLRSRRLVSRAIAKTSPPAAWSWDDVAARAESLAPALGEERLAILEALARVEPTSPQIQRRLANALLAANQTDRALAAFDLALTHGEDEATQAGYVEAASRQTSDAAAFVALLDRHDLRRAGGRDLCARLIIKLVQAGAYEATAPCLTSVFGPACHGLREGAEDLGKYSVSVVFSEAGFEFVFGPNYLRWGFLTDRLIALSGYLQKLHAARQPVGRLRISLGDWADGDAPQLCFSARPDPNHHLVPDAIFLQSDGYAGFRRQAAVAPPWSERQDGAYWRGSLTGDAHTLHDAVALPRIDLCLIALSQPRLDAKITDLSQFGPLLPNLELITEGLGVIGPKRPDTDGLAYRYAVDVDGNTNSWPGLFTKLLSGSPVIKLKSEYRQWYYDRLRHGENIYLVDALHPGLEQALAWGDASPASARTMGQKARRLALSMTPASEYPIFERGALAVLRQTA